MGITLKNVFRTTLKITDDISIPIVQAIVDIDSDTLVVNDLTSFRESLYYICKGVVALAQFGTYGSDYILWDDIPTGTYGDSTSFQLNINKYYGSKGIEYIYYIISYNSKSIVSGLVPATSVTGEYRASFPILCTNEDSTIAYHINGAAIVQKSKSTQGYTNVDNIYLTGVIGSGEIVSITGSGTIYQNTSNYNIDISGGKSSFIKRENPANKDPYKNGGDSSTGGGSGTFSDEGENIGVPDISSLNSGASALATGFITLFNPSLSELKSLASYMWSDAFDLDTFRKLFADPMDAILGLSVVPVSIPSGGSGAVSVGNISTGISMNKAAQQYIEVDCGSLTIEEFWGAYLDYDPYTKFDIYLPYIGTHAIAADDIMNKTISIKYHVDILSGACCAYISADNTVIYSFIGQCASSIPISGNDWTNVINGVMSIAGSVGSMIATGGASAPMAAANIASTAVNSLKPNVEKSGAMSGTGGLLGVQTPYLIKTRPRQALPEMQNSFTGYPSFINESLAALSGYTEIEEIHLDNIAATDNEKSEIEALLKSGVIF